MNERILTIAAALLCSALAACGGPDLGSAEACAKSYQAALLEQRNADMADRLARMKWDLDCMEAALPWFADKSKLEKEMKDERAKYEFERANQSALSKYEIEIVGVADEKDGDKVTGKRVELRIKGKQRSKKAEAEYELKDDEDKVTLACTQIEGKWKIKNK